VGAATHAGFFRRCPDMPPVLGADRRACLHHGSRGSQEDPGAPGPAFERSAPRAGPLRAARGAGGDVRGVGGGGGSPCGAGSAVGGLRSRIYLPYPSRGRRAFRERLGRRGAPAGRETSFRRPTPRRRPFPPCDSILTSPPIAFKLNLVGLNRDDAPYNPITDILQAWTGRIPVGHPTSWMRSRLFGTL
jgi:hypothetical protein